MASVGRKKSKRADVGSLKIIRAMQQEADTSLLNQEESNVLVMRYSGATMREIAEAYHLSRQQVHNILKSGERKLIAWKIKASGSTG